MPMDTIYVGEGGGYYGGSAILTVRENEDRLRYEFRPSGWDFDTYSQLEAASICASADEGFMDKLMKSKLTSLPLDEASDSDINEALYWLTGGNREWFHGYWAEECIKWDDDVLDRLKGDSEIMGSLNKAISSASNFAELVSELRKIYSPDSCDDTNSIFVCATDVLSDLAVCDDEDYDYV